MLKYLKNKSGASMIVVIIIFIIFLVLGVSMLVASSVAAGTSAKNRDNKQLYFYAKSAADTIDSSVQAPNGLGNEIINIVASMMINNQTVPSEMELSCNLSLLEDGTTYDEVSYEAVSIKLRGIEAIKTQNYTINYYANYKVTENYNINISRMTITYTTSYKGLKYRMDIEYAITASGKREGNVSGTEPVRSIDDLNLNALSSSVSWTEVNKTFVRIYQGG